MRKEEIINYMLSKPGTSIDTPFRVPVPVAKVGSKMFATINIHEEKESINLKYPKGGNGALRKAYEYVKPGYHMNKEHWNTVYLEGDAHHIRQLIDISYELVFDSLTKKEKTEIMEGSNDT